jgi:nitrogen fixation NifU-like protein
MSDNNLRELYQETIIGHAKRPKNFRKIEGADRMLEGYNPLCGDRLTLYLKLAGDVIADAAFEGAGCAISTASASLLTESVKGKTVAQAEALIEAFHGLVTGSPDQVPDTAKLGKLAVFTGVCEYPSRVKCAILSWHTLKSALHGAGQPVSTE